MVRTGALESRKWTLSLVFHKRVRCQNVRDASLVFRKSSPKHGLLPGPKGGGGEVQRAGAPETSWGSGIFAFRGAASMATLRYAFGSRSASFALSIRL